MSLDFYNHIGKPIAYSDDGENIYLFSGEPLCYIVDDAIYSFDGKHVGWFDDGWIRDLNGKCVYFTVGATGGAVKPIRRLKPIKSVKQIKPIKAVKEVKEIKAVKSKIWSSNTLY